MKARSATISLFAALLLALPVAAQVNDQASDKDRLQYLDVFEMEVAADPRISPDGSRVVYVRRGSDIMTDRSRTALWAIDSDGANHRALTDGNSAVDSPRWAPDGNRLEPALRSMDGYRPDRRAHQCD
jgi:Tol biopolymer transport system component